MKETLLHANKHADFIFPFGNMKGNGSEKYRSKYLRWLSALGAAKKNSHPDTALWGLGASSLPRDEQVGRRRLTTYR
jgi:hypothetical protein